MSTEQEPNGTNTPKKDLTFDNTDEYSNAVEYVAEMLNDEEHVDFFSLPFSYKEVRYFLEDDELREFFLANLDWLEQAILLKRMSSAEVVETLCNRLTGDDRENVGEEDSKKYLRMRLLSLCFFTDLSSYDFSKFRNLERAANIGKLKTSSVFFSLLQEEKKEGKKVEDYRLPKLLKNETIIKIAKNKWFDRIAKEPVVEKALLKHFVECFREQGEKYEDPSELSEEDIKKWHGKNISARVAASFYYFPLKITPDDVRENGLISTSAGDLYLADHSLVEITQNFLIRSFTSLKSCNLEDIDANKKLIPFLTSKEQDKLLSIKSSKEIWSTKEFKEAKELILSQRKDFFEDLKTLLEGPEAESILTFFAVSSGIRGFFGLHFKNSNNFREKNNPVLLEETKNFSKGFFLSKIVTAVKNKQPIDDFFARDLTEKITLESFSQIKKKGFYGEKEFKIKAREEFSKKEMKIDKKILNDFFATEEFASPETLSFFEDTTVWNCLTQKCVEDFWRKYCQKEEEESANWKLKLTSEQIGIWAYQTPWLNQKIRENPNSRRISEQCFRISYILELYKLTFYQLEKPDCYQMCNEDFEYYFDKGFYGAMAAQLSYLGFKHEEISLASDGVTVCFSNFDLIVKILNDEGSEISYSNCSSKFFLGIKDNSGIISVALFKKNRYEITKSLYQIIFDLREEIKKQKDLYDKNKEGDSSEDSLNKISTEIERLKKKEIEKIAECDELFGGNLEQFEFEESKVKNYRAAGQEKSIVQQQLPSRGGAVKDVETVEKKIKEITPVAQVIIKPEVKKPVERIIEPAKAAVEDKKEIPVKSSVPIKSIPEKTQAAVINPPSKSSSAPSKVDDSKIEKQQQKTISASGNSATVPVKRNQKENLTREKVVDELINNQPEQAIPTKVEVSATPSVVRALDQPPKPTSVASTSNAKARKDGVNSVAESGPSSTNTKATTPAPSPKKEFYKESLFWWIFIPALALVMFLLIIFTPLGTWLGIRSIKEKEETEDLSSET